MTASIIWGDTIIGDIALSKEILKPGQGYNIRSGTLMKYPNKMSIEENKIYEKLKSTLYMGLTNGMKSYGIVKYIYE